MNHERTNKLTLLLFLFSFSFIIPEKTLAKTLSFTLSPPLITISAHSPSNISIPLELENKSSVPLNFDITFKSFISSPKKNGELVYVSKNTGAQSAFFNKIEVIDNTTKVTSVIIGPLQKKALSLHIPINSNEKQADYYFSVVFTSKEDTMEEPNSQEGVYGRTKIVGALATNVLLSINPQEKSQATLNEFSTDFITTQGPVPFTILLQNTSNHFIRPQGSIIIKDIFGKPLKKIEFEKTNILAHTERYIPSLSKNGKSQQNVSSLPTAFWDEKVIVGPYQATLNLILSPQGPAISRTILFIGFPIYITVGLFLAIIITLTIFFRIRHHLRYSK